MPAKINGDDSIRVRKLIKLVFPLPGLASITVEKDYRSGSMLWSDIDHREMNRRLGWNLDR
jgi:hypothetical protein